MKKNVLAIFIFKTFSVPVDQHVKKNVISIARLAIESENLFVLFFGYFPFLRGAKHFILF